MGLLRRVCRLMDSTGRSRVDNSQGGSGTLGLSTQPVRAELPASIGTGGAGYGAPSLTSEAVSDAQARLAALAETFDRAIGGAEVFCTNTLRDPPARPGSPLFTSIGHAGGVRALTGWLIDAAEVYPDIAAAYAMEPHAARVAPHFHGLLAGLGDGVAAAVDRGRRKSAGSAEPVSAPFGVRQARDRLWGAWFERHGMARLEAVDGNGAALYVAKYSLKGGDDVPWWRVWEPGELRDEWARQVRRKLRVRG